MGYAEYYASEGRGSAEVTDPYVEEVLALNAKLIARCEELEAALQLCAEIDGGADRLSWGDVLAACRRAREALEQQP